MPSRSITLRLTLSFSAATALVLLAFGYWVGANVEKHFEEQDQHEFETKLTLIRRALAQVRVPGELPQVARRIEDALVGHHGLSVAVAWKDGGTLFATPDAALLSPLLASRSGTAQPLVWTWQGESYRGILVEADSGIAKASPLRIAIALNIAHHLEFLSSFRQSLWFAVVICILLTALLGWLAARRGLLPVRDMARIAHGISASRLEHRLPIEAVPAELTQLADAFNEMLGRLEDSFRRLSEFSSDLAHELRTPISNLMTQTQVALGKARSAEEYREVLYGNLEEYERLASMIADMLFLAQADHGLLVPRREVVDLQKELAGLFDFYGALAEEQGVTLAQRGTGLVSGDPAMLRRALSNLLANALRHSPRGETVDVRLESASGKPVRLIVANCGEGIPAEHLPRIFDRFYRVDPARQRGGEGAGLGLAIVKSIIQAHGGSIVARSQPGRTEFELLLPSA